MTEEANPFDISQDVTSEDIAVAPTADELKSVAELGASQLALEDEIEDIETLLKAKKAELAKISQDLLPTTLENIGLSEFKLANGAKIALESDISISIPKAKLGSIVEWLNANNHADVVQSTITIELGRGSSNERELITGLLAENDVEFVDGLNVNAATLKAILRKELESGKDVKLADFGAYAWKRTKIKK